MGVESHNRRKDVRGGVAAGEQRARVCVPVVGWLVEAAGAGASGQGDVGGALRSTQERCSAAAAAIGRGAGWQWGWAG